MPHSSANNPVTKLLVRDAQGDDRPANAEEVVNAARRVVGRRFRRGTSLSSPQPVRDFLRMKMGELEHEIFLALLADSQNRLIDYVELFRGTLAQTSVYPREVVKVALTKNAAAMIFAHFVARHKMRVMCPVLFCCDGGLMR